MALKAKLANKGRLRPHEMICKKMPDGTGSLQDLPMRAHGAAAEDEAADGEYCKQGDRPGDGGVREAEPRSSYRAVHYSRTSGGEISPYEKGCVSRGVCFLTTPGGVKPPLGRKVTTAEADHTPLPTTE